MTETKNQKNPGLKFGTGGLRGVMGEATDQMNVINIRKATQGLANYLIKRNRAQQGVAIAYDSRLMSEAFAKETAACLNGNGITTHIYSQLMPTPMLSFAVRHLHCAAGIVITASHNPSEYNGYKVYGADGGQITSPTDKEISSEIALVEDNSQIHILAEEQAVQKGLFRVIGEEVENAYYAEIKRRMMNTDTIRQAASELRIVYTPLHGTGNLPVRHILQETGFDQVHVVAEQELPDGHFPTVKSPNPEEPDAFCLALALARQVDADLVLATDPDADRLGVYVKASDNGTYQMLNGNMTGILLCDYLLSRRQDQGILKADSTVIKTIVTTKMAEPLTRHYHVRLMDVLTGFKYIGEKMQQFEMEQTGTFEFGFEESYGCLIQDCVRDKDAVSAAAFLCEAAAYYRLQGQGLWERLQTLYQQFGYYKENLFTETLSGADGTARISALMESLRNQVPQTIGSYTTIQMEDYQSGVITDMKTGEQKPTGLPESNVLRFVLNDDAWFCIRPSGTEPKIKYYCGVKGISQADADNRLLILQEAIKTLGH